MDVVNSTVVVLLYFSNQLFLLTLIIVDRMIRVAGHGKDVVDRINACDKRYLMGKCVWLVHQRLIINNQERILIQW